MSGAGPFGLNGPGFDFVSIFGFPLSNFQGWVTDANSGSGGNQLGDPANCATPICVGDGTVAGFGSWDWPSPDEGTNPYIQEISRELAPLNKLSDCAGAAVVHQIPLVPNKWLDKAFNIAPQPEEKTAASQSIKAAEKVHSGLEKTSDLKWPARAVWGLQKAGLPAASEAARGGLNKVVPKLAPYASTLKATGYALTAISATYETVSCYNKP